MVRKDKKRKEKKRKGKGESGATLFELHVARCSCCSTLQYTAAIRSTLRLTAARWSTL